MSAPSMHPPAPSPHAGLAPAAAPPSRVLGYAVMAVAVAITGVHVLSLALAGPAAERYEQALLGGGSTLDVHTAYDLATTFLLPLQLLALVLTGLWLLRWRRFGERVQPHVPHARRRWWAFGSWLVPIVSLWFPYQYVRDVQASLHPTGWQGGFLVAWWWFSFLAMHVLDRVTSKVSMSQNPDIVSQLPVFAATLGVVSVVALVLWVALIHHLHQAGDEVPAEVLQRTAYAPDPDAYDHQQVPTGAPLYGPGTLPPAVTPPGTPPGHHPPPRPPERGAGSPGPG